eukprot:1195120-Prorocentrum_minimum.AAC.6
MGAPAQRAPRGGPDKRSAPPAPAEGRGSARQAAPTPPPAHAHSVHRNPAISTTPRITARTAVDHDCTSHDRVVLLYERWVFAIGIRFSIQASGAGTTRSPHRQSY